MKAASLHQRFRGKWKFWGLSTLLAATLLLFYSGRPDFTFYDVNYFSLHGNNSEYWKELSQKLSETQSPWWEADDCQCKSKACDSPSTMARVMGVKNIETGGTCGRRAWAAGDGQRVLSYSLYGSNSEYWTGLSQILSEVEQLYPGWKVRLYTNPRGREAVLCPLLHRYSSKFFVCDITNLPTPLGNLSNVNPRVWRMAALGDPQVTTLGVRDSDSQITTRETAAVQEWLSSGKAFHVMRDHPFHGTPMLAGMWGARWDTETGPTMRALRDKMIALATFKMDGGRDQAILGMLWPTIKKQVIEHDSYNCKFYKGSSPWPTQRVDGKFVGLPRFRKRFENSSIPKPCPKECRPPLHPDWEYC